MLIVDRVCLRLVLKESNDESPLLISGFPEVRQPRFVVKSSPAAVADLLEAGFRALRLAPEPGNARHAVEVYAAIVSNAVQAIPYHRDDGSLDVFMLFQREISQISDRYAQLYDDFHTSLTSKDSFSGIDSKTPRKLETVKCGIDIADTIEELHMLAKLFLVQNEILTKAISEFDERQLLSVLSSISSALEWLSLVLRDNRDKLQGLNGLVETMLKDAERVQDNLTNLLDLQQKEDSFHEAKRANQQALFAAKQALASQASSDATNAQSQILFVFTGVTIVFLPLSFFVSLYGSDYAYIGGIGPQDDKSPSAEQRSYVYRVIYGVSATLIVFFGIMAIALFFCTKWSSEYDRIKDLVELRKGRYLPDGLIKEDDEEKAKMERVESLLPREKSQAIGPTTTGTTTAADAAGGQKGVFDGTGASPTTSTCSIPNDSHDSQNADGGASLYDEAHGSQIINKKSDVSDEPPSVKEENEEDSLLDGTHDNWRAYKTLEFRQWRHNKVDGLHKWHDKNLKAGLGALKWRPGKAIDESPA